MDHSPHSSPFPRESTLTQSTILHSLPLTRFPPNSNTSPYPSTLKHVSHSHFYQCPPSLKNEPILARSPSCLGVSPSFLAPTFILLNPSKRTFNHPSIPFPSREIPPNLFHFRPPNRPFFTPFFATSPSTVSNSSTQKSFSAFCSERVLDAIHIPSLSWNPRGRGSWRSSRSSRFTLFLTPTLTLAQPMKFVGSQLNLNAIRLESALRPSGWKLQRVSKLRIWLSRVYVCVWWNSLVNQAMTEQIQAKPRFFHVAS